VTGAGFAWWAASQMAKQEKISRWKLLAWLALILTVVLTLSLLVAAFFYDLSWDGLWYHASGIIQLIQGWNPFRDLPLKGESSTGPVIAAPLLNHFTKGHWLLAAAIYQATGSIELGKAFNLIFAASAFFLSYVALSSLENLRPWLALALSAFLTINPVIVNQSLSYYCDGQLASLLVCLVCILIVLYKEVNKVRLGILCTVIILIVNVKITGLVYAIVICGGFFLLLVVSKRYAIKSLIFALAFSFLLGALFVGYNPYVINTIHSRWQDTYSLTLIEGNTPASMQTMSSAQKFFVSLFSRSQGSIEPTHLKWPFTIAREEYFAFRYGDTRVAGFGPLFSGVTLIVFVVLASSLIMGRKSHSSDFYLLLFTIALIAISVAINPDAWWARYVPQVWMCPILVVAMDCQINASRRLFSFLNGLLIVVLFTNCAFTTLAFLSFQIPDNLELKQQLHELAVQTEPTLVDFNEFIGNRFRFDNLGIKYIQTHELPCHKPELLGNIHDSYFCKPGTIP